MDANTMTRVLLIGLDGASFDTVNSLVETGELPNFAKFVTDGCAGAMKTTIPPSSAAAWSTLATGMNPGKHGVFYFVTRNGNLILSSKIAGKTVWDIVGSSGKKVILLNMPFTFPPYPVNGIMVSGFPCPLNRLAVFPRHLRTELSRVVPGYQADVTYLKRQFGGMVKERFYREACEITVQRLNLAVYLMKKYHWDFFAVVFTNLDRVQHMFWGDQSDYLPRYYKLLDKALGHLSPLKDCSTLIVSDHGFEHLDKFFGLNNWLEKKGFLKTTTKRSRKSVFRLLSNLKHIVPLKVKRRIPLSARLKVLSPQSDFSKTVAYSPFQGAIFSQPRYRRLIKKMLLRLDFVDRVYEKEEVYTGEHVKEAPDLLVLLKSGYECQPWAKDIIEVLAKTSQKVSLSSKTGTHQGLSAQRGALFMAKGELIKKGRLNTEIIDIAPTILKLMDIKIPKTMEGRVLDIFKES